MKKYLILASAAIVAMAACTKVELDENIPAKKITFQAASYVPQTKAEVSVMSEFTSFTCKAFLHAAGYSDVQNMFGDNGETISAWTNGNVITTTPADVAYWAPSHDYYWPKDASSYVNFVAWYDANGTAPTTATEESLSWTNYTVDTDDNLLYADEAWRYKSNPDAEYHKDGSVSEGVPMLFHHALAQLCIKAAVSKVNEGSTYWDVTLSNIKLEGVYNKGDLTLSNSAPTGTEAQAKAWSGSWAPASGATTATVSMDTPASSLTATLTDILSFQKVLPQTVTSNMKLKFDYNISYRYGANTADKEYAHEKISATIDLSTISGHIASWDMNKKITYNITINPETTVIRIDPAVDDWASVTGGSATL